MLAWACLFYKPCSEAFKLLKQKQLLNILIARFHM
jgi:hypothetical protein